MQVVRVGVGVKGMGVIVFVGIGVGMDVLVKDAVKVGVKTIAVPPAVSLYGDVSDNWVAVDEGVTCFEPSVTCPQACKRIIRIHRAVNLLRTLAVYHNKLTASSKLSPW